MAAPDPGAHPALTHLGVLAAIDAQHRAGAVIAMDEGWLPMRWMILKFGRPYLSR
jgi:hypothetical protein